jgi:TRAP-type C4-dicarboxylate transport system permease small subunit
MTALSRRLWKLLDAFVLFVFFVMLVLVTAQVFFRYILQVSVPWTEEAARWFYAWQIFLGSALAMKEGYHLRVTFVIERFPASLRAGVEVVTAVAGLVFLGGVAWGSLLMMRAVYPVEAGSFSLSTTYLYLAIPVSLAIMLALVLKELGSACAALLGPRQA